MEEEPGVSRASAAFTKRGALPLVVPVRAAPLTGAVPVPVRSWINEPLPALLFATVAVIFSRTLPVLVGVRDPARPIMTPVVDVVPVGFAGSSWREAAALAEPVPPFATGRTPETAL